MPRTKRPEWEKNLKNPLKRMDRPKSMREMTKLRRKDFKEFEPIKLKKFPKKFPKKLREKASLE